MIKKFKTISIFKKACEELFKNYITTGDSVVIYYVYAI